MTAKFGALYLLIVIFVLVRTFSENLRRPS